MNISPLRAAILLNCALIAHPACAGSAEDIYVFNVSEQSVDSAINVIAEQSNTPAIFSFEKVSHIRANSLNGSYSLDDALKTLLSGTGLIATLTAEGVITVTPEKSSETQGEKSMDIKPKKNLLVGTASVFASILSANAAAAQDVPTNPGFANDEIIVTARRTSENLQKTPIAITAVTGEAMEKRGYQDVAQIASITPNVVFDGASPVSGNSSAPSVFIRGVGQLDFTINSDPGVGIYVDGVYMARSVGGIIDLLDVERVEVLRGPQGTLFGRNTIGGAIQLISKKPSGEFGGYVEGLTGSDNRIRVQGALDVPLGDTLAAKVTGAYHTRDGYVTNGIGQDLGDDNTYSLRGQLLFEPTDNFSAYIVGDYTKDDENGAANVGLTAFPDGNFPGVRYNIMPGFGCGAPAVPLLPNGNLNTNDPSYQNYLAFINNNPDCFDISDISTDRSRTNSTTFALSENEIYGVSGTLEYDFGSVSVKSITAYRELESRFQRDSDHTAFSIFDTSNFQTQDQFSQELLVAGDFNDLTVVAGAYYFQENATEDTNIFLPGAGGPVNVRGVFDNRVENENIAVFGEATYDVTDRLHLTGGVRYTEEDKTYATNQNITLSSLPPVQNIAITDFNNIGEIPDGFPTLAALVNDPGQTASVENVDYRINLAYDINDNVLGYLTHSTGFKSGGFNPRYLAPTTTGLAISYDPEFVDLYEAGLKMDLADNRLRLNLAAFLMDYTDIQVSASTPESSGARVTQNAAEATIKGIEAEFTLVPQSNVVIEGSLGLLDAEYGEDGLAELGFACGLSCDFPRIPEITSSFGISYIHDLAKGTLTPRLDWSHKSSVEGDANNAAEIEHPEQDIFNASLAYENEMQDWRLTVGVSNITDEDYFTSSNNNPRLSYSEVIFGRGREWYASVRKTF